MVAAVEETRGHQPRGAGTPAGGGREEHDATRDLAVLWVGNEVEGHRPHGISLAEPTARRGARETRFDPPGPGPWPNQPAVGDDGENPAGAVSINGHGRGLGNADRL